MGLIERLFGAPAASTRGSARTSADVVAALARLGAERRAAQDAIADALKQREHLLLVDETDARIDELDVLADRHRRTVERCAEAEPLLVAELQTLRAEEKRARWRDLVARHAVESRVFAGHLREAIDAHEGLIAIVSEAHGAGLATEAASLPLLPRIISRDALAQLELELDRADDVRARADQPPPPPRVGSPAPAPDADGRIEVTFTKGGFFLENSRATANAGAVFSLQPEVAQRAVAEGFAVYGAPTPPKAANKPKAAKPSPAPPAPAPPSAAAPFVPTIDADGKIRVKLLKKGVSVDGIRDGEVGDEYLIPSEQAYGLVKRSVAEFAEYLEGQK